MARHHNPAWSARRVTDSAQRILWQISDRAGDRGLYVVDGSSLPPMLLWSVLLWERKVGLVALERLGINRFALATEIDRLLVEMATEHPIAFDENRNMTVFAKTREPYRHWDVDAALEPLLSRAEHESREMGTDYVGSEHLVLAAIALSDQTLSGILRKHGIDHDTARQAVLGVLGR